MFSYWSLDIVLHVSVCVGGLFDKGTVLHAQGPGLGFYKVQQFQWQNGDFSLLSSAQRRRLGGRRLPTGLHPFGRPEVKHQRTPERLSPPPPLQQRTAVLVGSPVLPPHPFLSRRIPGASPPSPPVSDFISRAVTAEVALSCFRGRRPVEEISRTLCLAS